MDEPQLIPPSSGPFNLNRPKGLDLIRHKVESVVSSREQLKTITSTLIVGNLSIAIVDYLSNPKVTGLFAFLCFILVLTIYSYGVWSVATESYPNLILFAGLLMLIRFANLFSLMTTDNILISLGIITFIILNELFVVQGKSFPSGQLQLPKFWSSTADHQQQQSTSSSAVDQQQNYPSFTTVNIN